MSANPALTNKQVVEIIKANTVQPAGYSALYWGTGLIDACKALKAAVPSSTVTC